MPGTTFLSGSEADSREELAGESLCIGTLSSVRFSVNSCKRSGRSCNGSPSTSSLTLSLRIDAGRDVDFTESCGDDVGDVDVDELEEPLAKPGTTIGT